MFMDQKTLGRGCEMKLLVRRQGALESGPWGPRLPSPALVATPHMSAQQRGLRLCLGCLVCSSECGIFRDQPWIPCLLNGQADSLTTGPSGKAYFDS